MSDFDIEKIGEKIKYLRETHNLTQGDLADKLNVSRKVISKWENGEGLPSVDLLMSLSRTLGVSVEDLLESDKEIKSTNEITVFPPYRLTRIFVSAVVLVVLFFLLIYWATTFNKFRVYSIYSTNAQMTGNFVVAKNRRIFNINSVRLTDSNLDNKKYYAIQYKVLLNDESIMEIGDVSNYKFEDGNELKSLKDYINDISVYIIDDLPNFADPLKNNYTIRINYIDENLEEQSYVIKFKMNEFFANNQLFYENYEI